MDGCSAGLAALTVSLVSMLGAPAPPTPAPAPAGSHAEARPSELVNQRTDSSTTYQSPNGSRIVVLSSGPVRFQRDGRWTPIDLTLRKDADGAVRPVSAPYPMWLSGGGPSPDAAAVRSPTGLNTALAWDAPLPAPQLRGSTARYPNARPGADLLIELTRAGFAAELVPTGQDATTAALDPAAIGPALALRQTRTGQATVPVPTLGAIAARAAPPGALADTAVADRVVAVADHRLSPPLSTTVQNTAPDGDLSGDPDLRIGNLDGGTVSRGFLTWDLSRLLSQNVTKATLRLYQEWSPSCQPVTWQIWASGPIDPATRWANQPAPTRMWASSTASRGFGPACQAGWTNVDLTSLVQAWVRAGQRTGTVLLRAGDESSPASWKRFASGQGPNAPALGITLAPQATP